MKRLILLHTLLFSLVAHASLDTNNNGLSDLWEKQYNDGQLFSPTNPEHLPNADPDLDGWDNRTEAAAGTDPSLANPPEGTVANTLLPSATAGAYTLTWPTRIGKRYQLQVSTDLESWLSVGNPIIAENTSHSIGINVTEPGSPTPPKLFWHILIDDIDSDIDGLTNNEEHQLGTNPNAPDSDGDTLNDLHEILAHTNPLHRDTDLDGIPDNLDGTPLQNNAISDPDNIGLPASLATDFIGNWDFETLFTRTNPPAGHTALYFDDLTTSNRDATSFSVNNTTDGMVSKAANHTQTFSHIHRSLLQDRSTFTISLWAKIPADAIANNAAGLFTHHNYEPVVTNGTPNWGLISATTNGLWLQKNGNNIELHAGSYLYTNWQYVNSQIQLRNPPLTLTEGVVKTYAPGVINDDRWHHIVMIRVSGTTKLYVDNILEGSSTDPLFTVNNNNYSACSIGRLYGYSADTGLTQPATNPFLFKGKIDRLKVWKRGLTTSGTTSEVAALYQQDIDNDGLWDITENNTKLWRDTNSNGIQELSELTYQNDPFHWQPLDHDTDGDGLTDIQEQSLGTGIATPDSDFDLMPDGWEFTHGLNPKNPVDATLDNDTGGADGLTNLDEYRYNTDPKNRDTDGDGKLDGAEAKGTDGNPATDDGSNPNDASDNGIRPPANELLTLKLGVGDRSASHSEDYVLNVFQLQADGTEKRIYTLRSGGFGQYKEETRSFPKSQSYTFQIDWQGTNNNAQSPGTANAEGADFDYHLVVEPLSGNQSHLLIDSYDPRTKTADPSTPLRDTGDINPSDDDNDNITTFLTTHEPKRVLFLTAPITSRDRLIEGDISILSHLFHSFDLAFSTATENLGSYSFGSGTTSGYIFSSTDEVFSDDELAMVNSTIPNPDDHRIADQTIFYRNTEQPIQIKWFTALNTISEFKITLSQSGVALGQLKHMPTFESNFSGLMDHLALRTSSSNMPVLASISEPTTEIGIDDEEDPPPAILPIPPPPLPAPAPLSVPTMTGTSRNLWAKVCFISNVAWEKTKHETIKNLKLGGGFVKGYSDGLIDGFKADAEGVQELGLMTFESLQGNHARAKQFWDGIKMLANMSSAERAVMFDNMQLTFLEKAQAEVPWDASANNVTDDWGVAAYMSGYAGGFVSEQVIMIYVTAGIGKGVMWLGNGVKNAMLATRAGVVVGQVISATQKFLVGAFLSVTKHVVTLGEEGIRSGQAIMRHLSQKSYLGLRAADMTHEVIIRLTPVRMSYQMFANLVAPHCTTVSAWMQYGYGCYKRMCEICTIGRLVLNESAMRGFARLYPALRSPTNASADFAEHLLNVCRNTPTSPVDAASLNAVLELFDSAKVGFKLTPDPTDATTWISPAGVVYETNQFCKEGSRISHVLAHTVDGYIVPGKLVPKPQHSLFSVSRSNVFELIDEAWQLKQGLGTLQGNGNRVWIVEISRQTGTQGQTKVMLVVKDGTNIIISAYPQ